MRTIADRLKRWIAFAMKLLDKKHTGYLIVYAKDGQIQHYSEVSSEKFVVTTDEK